MKFILLVSHGSQSSKTVEEIKLLLGRLRNLVSDWSFEYAFLDIESPDIPQGLLNCISKGATEIVVLLNFLNSGRHVDQDIPGQIDIVRSQHPRVKICVSRPVGQHERIVELFLDLIVEASRF